MTEPITEYRRDGWPLCPRCGEDEVMSWLDTDCVLAHIEQHGDKPSREEYLMAELSCLYCGWVRPERKRAREAQTASGK